MERPQSSDNPEEEGLLSDDPILSSEAGGELVTKDVNDKQDGAEKGLTQQTFEPVSEELCYGNETNTRRLDEEPSSKNQIVSQASVAQDGSSKKVVSEPYCENCDRKWHQCLSGMPVHPNQRLSDLVPFSVISCGPYWEEKRRGRAATVLAVSDQNAIGCAKGVSVRVKCMI